MNAPSTVITESPLFGNVPVERIITRPYQPRQTFNEEDLNELAASLAKDGQLQPILLRPAPCQPDFFELVAGERRLRAAKIAGMTEILSLVREMTEIEVATAQLIENIQRKGVNPLEEAAAIHRLQTEFNMNVEQICEELSMKRAQVYARLKLLELPETTKDKVKDGTINASTALLIARLPSDEEKTQATNKIVEGDGGGAPMSVREAKEYIDTNHHHQLDDSAATDVDGTENQSHDRDATTSAAIAEFNTSTTKARKSKKLSKAELESIEKKRISAEVAAKETTYYRSVYMAVRSNIAADYRPFPESRLPSVYGFLARAAVTRGDGYSVIDVVAATYPFDFDDATAVAEFAATASNCQVALLHLDSLILDATEIADWRIHDGSFALEKYDQKHALIALLDIATLYDVDVAALYAAAFPPPTPQPEKEAEKVRTSTKSPARPKAKVASKKTDSKPSATVPTAETPKKKTVRNPAAAWPFPTSSTKNKTSDVTPPASGDDQTPEGDA